MSLLNDLSEKTDASIISSRFHRGLANIIVETASLLADKNKVKRIALSGGVFQNRTLLELVVSGLEHKKLQALTHHQIPANDGGIALGQAVIATAQEIKRRR